MDKKATPEETGKRINEMRNSEQKCQQMKNLLKEEIARWRLIFEQSRDGIVILDQRGKVYEVNTRYADMLGYSVEEMHHLHVWDWDVRFTKEELSVMLAEVDSSGAHFETRQCRKDGTIIDVELSNNGSEYRGEKLILCICRNITERKLFEKERTELIGKLREALAEIRTLQGILPICSNCKKIRGDKGVWEQIEVYIRNHSDAEFSHGLCPECMKKLYPELVEPPS